MIELFELAGAINMFPHADVREKGVVIPADMACGGSKECAEIDVVWSDVPDFRIPSLRALSVPAKSDMPATDLTTRTAG
jgi:hypothetical protein